MVYKKLSSILFMERRNLIYLILFLIAILVLINAAFFTMSVDQTKKSFSNVIYNPKINPSEFSSNIDNKYFSLTTGKKLVYEADTEDGKERIEILIPGWTKEVMRVETLVFWDRVYLNGELIEDTRDYVAQDKEGNVWYFGENVDNYVDGILTDHHGAWIGGVDGALPGIWMRANPKVGDKYRQEYYKGEAEDMGRVDALMVRVTTPTGTFNDCIKIFEWTPLESATAYKYHCSEIGWTALEEENNERVELIEIDLDGAKGIAVPSRYADEGVVQKGALAVDTTENEPVEELKKEISEKEAREIALREVPGRVADIAIEKRFGKITYVVEIEPDIGSESDVIIDINTGEVLGVER